jgi:hypothetical protein
MEEKKIWPISCFTGEFPAGAWRFVREYYGTESEAYALAAALEAERDDGQYRVWDCRE